MLHLSRVQIMYIWVSFRSNLDLVYLDKIPFRVGLSQYPPKLHHVHGVQWSELGQKSVVTPLFFFFFFLHRRFDLHFVVKQQLGSNTLGKQGRFLNTHVNYLNIGYS